MILLNNIVTTTANAERFHGSDAFGSHAVLPCGIILLVPSAFLCNSLGHLVLVGGVILKVPFVVVCNPFGNIVDILQCNTVKISEMT